ncbi:aminoglycoside phosphotransferase family protein [Nonomuraea ferruginea]
MIYRLGEQLSVRLPRHSGAIGQAEKELEWLPRLAPRLPLAIPVPVGVGEPGFGYPWRWAVSSWLEGEVATVEALADSSTAAVRLAEFLAALRQFAPEDIQALATRESLQGPPLVGRDRATRAAIAEVGGVFDATAMTELWNAAVNAPGWDRPPVWFHGDFHTGNLLTVDGRLSVVIDFGGLGIGDPACDLMIAFTLMSAKQPGRLPRRARRGRRHLDPGSRLGPRHRPERLHRLCRCRPEGRRADHPSDYRGTHRLDQNLRPLQPGSAQSWEVRAVRAHSSHVSGDQPRSRTKIR